MCKHLSLPFLFFSYCHRHTCRWRKSLHLPAGGVVVCSDEEGEEEWECALCAGLSLSTYLLPYLPIWFTPFDDLRFMISCRRFFYYRWLRERLTSGMRKPPPLITSERPFESNWTPQTFRDLCLLVVNWVMGLKRDSCNMYLVICRFLIGLNMIWYIYSGHVYISCIFGTSKVCKYAQECLLYHLCVVP